MNRRQFLQRMLAAAAAAPVAYSFLGGMGGGLWTPETFGGVAVDRMKELVVPGMGSWKDIAGHRADLLRPRLDKAYYMRMWRELQNLRPRDRRAAYYAKVAEGLMPAITAKTRDWFSFEGIPVRAD